MNLAPGRVAVRLSSVLSKIKNGQGKAVSLNVVRIAKDNPGRRQCLSPQSGLRRTSISVQMLKVCL